MASKLSPTAPGDPPLLPEYRMVLLGKVGAGKSKVARVLLGAKESKGESGMCILREGVVAGRRISVVDTPGWAPLSIERTSDRIKNEIIRSVTMCSPGPHAVILVLPIENHTDTPSMKELKTASRCMELLSKRVWRHSIVLFNCDGEMEEATIAEHIQKANKLLEKCGSRHYVLRSADHESQSQGLLQEIEKMVNENCGDIFLPQIYYDLFQSQIPPDVSELKRLYEQREEQLKLEFRKRISSCENQTVKETELRKRRGSLEGNPPSMNEDDKTRSPEAPKSTHQQEMPTLVNHLLESKPAAVIMLAAVIGALIGSVTGSAFGVLGAGVGIIIGVCIAVPLALWLINATMAAKQSLNTLQETKSTLYSI
ncbi:GTPase IMAP family member 9-like [Brachyhypopomus gauderio]|uniref:GTPase IMAP family member 9-like n=1 Tax=Brachyhypopomus gauderio TaxID=698409 RepID=UPI004041ADEB